MAQGYTLCNSLGIGICASVLAADLIVYGTKWDIFIVSRPAAVFWRILTVPFVKCVKDPYQRSPVMLELHKSTPLSPKAVSGL